MVEYSLSLDSLFYSLSDSTRRDMLRLLRIYDNMTISQIAIHYKMTFAGAAKHLSVLESAQLIRKRKKGRTQIVSLSPAAFKEMSSYLEGYRDMWEARFNRLDTLLNKKEN